MELLERYLQAVRFWLPRKQKQDIITELSEDLRCQIEEKETKLGRSLTDADLESILKRCGPPMLVANRYLPQRSLIGPSLFPLYWMVLKTSLLWTLGPWLLAWCVVVVLVPAYRADHPGASVLANLEAAGWVGLCVTAAVTLIFAVLDRIQARTRFLERWNPWRLPQLTKPSQPVRRSDSIAGLVFACVFLAWWLSAPHDWRLVFGPAAGILVVSPALHGFYVPVIVFTLLGMAQSAVNLVWPRWTWLPPVTRLITTGVGLGIATSMVQLYPYIVVTDASSHVARYSAAAVVVNQTILWSLVITVVVMLIMLIVYAFQCVGVFRRSMRGGDHQAAPLHT